MTNEAQGIKDITEASIYIEDEAVRRLESLTKELNKPNAIPMLAELLIEDWDNLTKRLSQLHKLLIILGGEDRMLAYNDRLEILLIKYTSMYEEWKKRNDMSEVVPENWAEKV